MSFLDCSYFVLRRPLINTSITSAYCLHDIRHVQPSLFLAIDSKRQLDVVLSWKSLKLQSSLLIKCILLLSFGNLRTSITLTLFQIACIFLHSSLYDFDYFLSASTFNTFLWYLFIPCNSYNLLTLLTCITVNNRSEETLMNMTSEK